MKTETRMKQFILGGVAVVLTILMIFMGGMKAKAAENVSGGFSKDTAVEITIGEKLYGQLDKQYTNQYYYFDAEDSDDIWYILTYKKQDIFMSFWIEDEDGNKISNTDSAYETMKANLDENGRASCRDRVVRVV